MTDWNEFLQSDDFKAYRRKQAERIAEIIHYCANQATMGNPASLAELKGNLEIVSSIMGLPYTLTGDEGIKENLDRQYQEDLAHIVKYLIRTNIIREE